MLKYKITRRQCRRQMFNISRPDDFGEIFEWNLIKFWYFMKLNQPSKIFQSSKNFRSSKKLFICKSSFEINEVKIFFHNCIESSKSNFFTKKCNKFSTVYCSWEHLSWPVECEWTIFGLGFFPDWSPTCFFPNFSNQE